jgi:hypothetical protein
MFRYLLSKNVYFLKIDKNAFDLLSQEAKKGTKQLSTRKEKLVTLIQNLVPTFIIDLKNLKLNLISIINFEKKS